MKTQRYSVKLQIFLGQKKKYQIYDGLLWDVMSELIEARIQFGVICCTILLWLSLRIIKPISAFYLYNFKYI